MNSALTFRLLQETDLSLLYWWLNQPHMKQYYQKQPISLAEVEAKFTPRIRGEVLTFDHVVLLNEEPLGKLQCYRNIDHPDYANEIDLYEGISIDLFIGKPEMLGLGLGKKMLQSYVAKVAFPLFPDEQKCFICHDLNNTVALVCSRSAGFKPIRRVIEGGIQSELLVIERTSSALESHKQSLLT